ncbi:hypothetical protein NMG60_11005839 [Bertholletia excelsa]
MAVETENFLENGETRASRPSKRFLGVRQRPSGRWVAEIKDSSSHKLRLWLGTFDRPEEAARAYDTAARLLRGRNAKTNFSHNSIRPGHEESSSLLGKNPRLHTVLERAIAKNFSNYSSLISSGSINLNTLLEETFVCSPSSSSSSYSHSSGCCGGSKVYSSVIVAPSFSASPRDEGDQQPQPSESSVFSYADGLSKGSFV